MVVSKLKERQESKKSIKPVSKLRDRQETSNPLAESKAKKQTSLAQKRFTKATEQYEDTSDVFAEALFGDTDYTQAKAEYEQQYSNLLNNFSEYNQKLNRYRYKSNIKKSDIKQKDVAVKQGIYGRAYEGYSESMDILQEERDEYLDELGKLELDSSNKRQQEKQEYEQALSLFSDKINKLKLAGENIEVDINPDEQISNIEQSDVAAKQNIFNQAYEKYQESSENLSKERQEYVDELGVLRLDSEEKREGQEYKQAFSDFQTKVNKLGLAGQQLDIDINPNEQIAQEQEIAGELSAFEQQKQEMKDITLKELEPISDIKYNELFAKAKKLAPEKQDVFKKEKRYSVRYKSHGDWSKIGSSFTKDQINRRWKDLARGDRTPFEMMTERYDYKYDVRGRTEDIDTGKDIYTSDLGNAIAFYTPEGEVDRIISDKKKVYTAYKSGRVYRRKKEYAPWEIDFEDGQIKDITKFAYDRTESKYGRGRNYTKRNVYKNIKVEFDDEGQITSLIDKDVGRTKRNDYGSYGYNYFKPYVKKEVEFDGLVKKKNVFDNVMTGSRSDYSLRVGKNKDGSTYQTYDRTVSDKKYSVYLKESYDYTQGLQTTFSAPTPYIKKDYETARNYNRRIERRNRNLATPKKKNTGGTAFGGKPTFSSSREVIGSGTKSNPFKLEPFNIPKNTNSNFKPKKTVVQRLF